MASQKYTDYFKGKKITVVGLGLLGGVGDIRFLAECGADIIATDLKKEAELAPSLQVLGKFPNIHYTLGEHKLEDFRNRDLIIKAPSTPLDSPYINEARKNGIPVTMWAALFSRFAKEAGTAIVGVTGTRGKTTTTAMISEVLVRAGKKVIVGGNVQGTSILSQLSLADANSIAVLELDSWKIQGFRDEQISPHVGVFTTFYPDHLNYYGGKMDLYFADKALIFLYQTPEDTLILGHQVAPFIEEYGYKNKIKSHVTIVKENALPKSWKLNVMGEHNRYNAALAAEAARALGIDEEDIRSALESFKGVPGRLELVREVNGVKIYNDTTATTPEATIAGLRALDDKGMIHIIMGGADKGLDIEELQNTLIDTTLGVYLLAGTGTDRFLKLAPQLPVFTTLKDAVAVAYSKAKRGDIILFSPAFASFGMFKNEYDRGEQFNKLVEKL